MCYVSIIMRTISFVVCFFIIGIGDNKFYLASIFLLWLLTEVNLRLLNESKRRNKSLYDTNIVLILGTIILSFFNLDDIKTKINNAYMLYILFFLIALWLFILGFFNLMAFKKEKKEGNKKELLSFRKEELECLKEYIKLGYSNTILLDGKIGNGKTELIEKLIEDLSREKNSKIKKIESIYLKLPLIENIEELKKVVILELKAIFGKYRINANYLNEFLGKMSVFKTNFFEISFNTNQLNSWDSIQTLKSDLLELEKKEIRILIILDDIEREEDTDKIKKAIYFLGELSEYFRNTKATILFLAEYKRILKRLDEKKEEEYSIKDFQNSFELDRKNHSKTSNKNLLEKYFSYIMKISEIDLESLNAKDIDALIEIDMKDKDEKIEFMVRLLKEFSKAYKIIKSKSSPYEKYPIIILENVRNIKRFLGKISVISLRENFPSTIWLTINIINMCDIFMEVDLENKDYIKEKEKIKKQVFDNIMNIYGKKIEYSLVEKEIKEAEELIKKGKIIPEDFNTSFEKILKIIDEEKISKYKIKMDYFLEKAVLDYIGKDIKKFNILLKNSLELNKNLLEIKIIEIGELDALEDKSKEKIREILLRNKKSIIENELEKQELDREEFEAEKERNMSKAEKIEEQKTKWIQHVRNLTQILGKDFYFEDSISKLEEVLMSDIEVDLEELKYYLR